MIWLLVSFNVKQSFYGLIACHSRFHMGLSLAWLANLDCIGGILKWVLLGNINVCDCEVMNGWKRRRWWEVHWMETLKGKGCCMLHVFVMVSRVKLKIRDTVYELHALVTHYISFPSLEKSNNFVIHINLSHSSQNYGPTTATITNRGLQNQMSHRVLTPSIRIIAFWSLSTLAFACLYDGRENSCMCLG